MRGLLVLPLFLLFPCSPPPFSGLSRMVWDLSSNHGALTRLWLARWNTRSARWGSCPKPRDGASGHEIQNRLGGACFSGPVNLTPAALPRSQMRSAGTSALAGHDQHLEMIRQGHRVA